MMFWDMWIPLTLYLFVLQSFSFIKEWEFERGKKNSSRTKILVLKKKEAAKKQLTCFLNLIWVFCF